MSVALKTVKERMWKREREREKQRERETERERERERAAEHIEKYALSLPRIQYYNV